MLHAIVSALTKLCKNHVVMYHYSLREDNVSLGMCKVLSICGKVVRMWARLRLFRSKRVCVASTQASV